VNTVIVDHLLVTERRLGEWRVVAMPSWKRVSSRVLLLRSRVIAKLENPLGTAHAKRTKCLLLFRSTMLRGALYLTDGMCLRYVCGCVCVWGGGRCVVHNEFVKLGKTSSVCVCVCYCVGAKKFGINLFNGGGHPESTGKWLMCPRGIVAHATTFSRPKTHTERQYAGFYVMYILLYPCILYCIHALAFGFIFGNFITFSCRFWNHGITRWLSKNKRYIFMNNNKSVPEYYKYKFKFKNISIIRLDGFNLIIKPL